MINEKNRCNDLTGKEWLQNSFSIWRNLAKSSEEKEMKHPASFPVSLCEKLIRTFSRTGSTILDPFNGIGSTTAAAHNLSNSATGIDLSDIFCKIARSRVINDNNINIINGDSLVELDKMKDKTFDLCITSPPYWNILNMKRTVDVKENINYSDKINDLGNIDDYDNFLSDLCAIFYKVNRVLKDNAYCLVNVMDIRKKNKFYPLHSDLSTKMKIAGFELDDIIIWDRQNDYNNMRPLGYPYRYRINKVHEYILIFIKERHV